MAFVTSALLFLLSTQVFAAAVPDVPVHVMSSFITTLTVSTGSYDKTINTPDYGPECDPQCIGKTETTVTVPRINPKCKQTPTIVPTGPCAKRCAKSTSAIWHTAHVPAPTQFPIQGTEGEADEGNQACKRGAACLTTIWRSTTQQRGLTYTFHPLTETRTSLVDCKGCDLVVSEIQGPGPVVSRSVTITNKNPLIITEFACL